MTFSWSRLIVSLFLVVWYFAMPRVGYVWDGGFGSHFLYSLSHANIFHLLANVVCFWMIPCELHLFFAASVAFLCSFLPCFILEPTSGFSGVLFAVVGMSWGRVHRFKDMIWRNKWWLIVPVFIPHVNAFLHVYCLVLGYLVGCFVPMRKSDWL